MSFMTAFAHRPRVEEDEEEKRGGGGEEERYLNKDLKRSVRSLMLFVNTPPHLRSLIEPLFTTTITSHSSPTRSSPR